MASVRMAAVNSFCSCVRSATFAFRSPRQRLDQRLLFTRFGDVPPNQLASFGSLLQRLDILAQTSCRFDPRNLQIDRLNSRGAGGDLSRILMIFSRARRDVSSR